MEKNNEELNFEEDLKKVKKTLEGHLFIDGKEYIPILDEKGLEDIKEDCELEGLIYHILSINPLMRSLKEKYSESVFKKIFKKYFIDGLYKLKRDAWYTLEQKSENKPFVFRVAALRVPKVNSEENTSIFINKEPHLVIVDLDKNTNLEYFKEINFISQDEAIVSVNSEFVKNIRVSTGEEICYHLSNIAKNKYDNKFISPVVMSDDFSRSIELPQISEETLTDFEIPFNVSYLHHYDSLNDALISILPTPKGLGYFSLYSKGVWASIKKPKTKFIFVNVDVTTPDLPHSYESSLNIEEEKYEEFIKEFNFLIEKYNKSKEILEDLNSKDFICGCDLAGPFSDSNKVNLYGIRKNKDGNLHLFILDKI